MSGIILDNKIYNPILILKSKEIIPCSTLRIIVLIDVI